MIQHEEDAAISHIIELWWLWVFYCAHIHLTPPTRAAERQDENNHLPAFAARTVLASLVKILIPVQRHRFLFILLFWHSFVFLFPPYSLFTGEVLRVPWPWAYCSPGAASGTRRCSYPVDGTMTFSGL